MHSFKINVLIQFIVSSIRFEHHVFVIRKAICTCGFVMVCFSCIYASSLAGVRMCSVILTPAGLLIQMHKNIAYKSACTRGLLDNEHMMFETCRRKEELN